MENLKFDSKGLLQSLTYEEKIILNDKMLLLESYLNLIADESSERNRLSNLHLFPILRGLFSTVERSVFIKLPAIQYYIFSCFFNFLNHPR